MRTGESRDDHLTREAYWEIAGADGAQYLQGLITSDVGQITEKNAVLLTAQ
jgi:folate-binding Fe-S cluster repair protein YgfZ